MMLRDITTLIGLVFVGFVLGLLFLGRSYDRPARHQAGAPPKATATVHQDRHTPYAIP
jgi:hypothetical protein